MKDSNSVRVDINAYFRQHPLTGSGQYLAHLLAALPRVAPELEIVAYVPDSVGNARNRACGPAASHLAKLRFEQLALPTTAGGDLLHYPYWAAPLACKRPVVVTVHDIIPALLPAYRGSLFARCYTALVRVATKRAAAVIADSRASKHDIVTRLRMAPERVHVIYLAADPVFRPADGRYQASTLEKYGLVGPYVIYVGGLDQRKNVSRLIEAFARALPLIRGVTLAIAGDHLRRGVLFPDLAAVAKKLGLAEEVRFLGVVANSDLPALYAAATAFVFPSSYEGFGLPPLEALACGVPVISSNASSLPEVVGDAAILLDPGDVEGWAEALVRVVTDKDLSADLRRRGPAQAARFHWDETACATVEVYREALSRAGVEGR